MSTEKKHYRVSLVEWIRYGKIVKAESEEAAKAEGLRQFNEEGTWSFDCDDGDIDEKSIRAEECPPPP